MTCSIEEHSTATRWVDFQNPQIPTSAGKRAAMLGIGRAASQTTFLELAMAWSSLPGKQHIEFVSSL